MLVFFKEKKKMNIKERIEKLGNYFHSMNLSSENGIIYVRVQFPKGWGCSEVTEHNFNVKSVQDEIPGYFYFFATMEIGFDKVFDAIEYNIQFNEEAQAKVGLLKEKIEELKYIFENEDIEVLKTLEFRYKKKKPKKIKKNVREVVGVDIESKEDAIEGSINYDVNQYQFENEELNKTEENNK